MSESQASLSGRSNPVGEHEGQPSALEPVGHGARWMQAPRKLMVVDADEGNGQGQPPALRDAPTPLTLLMALGRCWKLGILIGLMLAVLLGVTVFVLRPDKYTADVLIRVAQAEQKLLNDSTRVAEVDRSNQYLKTQAALMTSRPVLRAILAQDKIRQLPLIQKQDDAMEWLEKELHVEIIPNTEVIRLSISSREYPDNLAPIVNAAQEAYMQEIVKGEHSQQLALLRDMEKIYVQSQDKLRIQRESLRRLADTLKTGDSQILTIKQKNLLEEYAALKREMAGIDARLRDAQVKRAAQELRIKSGKTAPPLASRIDKPGEGANKDVDDPSLLTMDAMYSRDLDQDPGIQKTLLEVSKLEEQIEQIRQVVRDPRDPIIATRMQELEALNKALEKMRDNRRQAAAKRFRASMQAEGMFGAQAIDEEVKIYTKQRENLLAEVAKLGREVDRIGVNSTELELKRNEIDQAEMVLKALRNEKERLQVELQSTAKRRVAVVAPAEDAIIAKKKARLMESAGGAVFGLMLGLFAVSYREFRTRRLYTPAQVSSGLCMRVMGTLPAIPAKQLTSRGQLTASQGDWGQILTESIDAIRTLLLQSSPDKGSSLLMIASACSGEGKTTLASHLAVSLGRAGRRTLLVDCDLRSPALHRSFNIARSPGMCELLTGTAQIEDCLHATPIDGVHFLAAGQYSSEAAMALAKGGLQAIFQKLRDQFDFVVIDSSPVLAVPDALIVGKAADGVVFSVRPGVSQAPLVHAAYERFQELGLPFLGSVVNGITDKSVYTPNKAYLSKVTQ